MSLLSRMVLRALLAVTPAITACSGVDRPPSTPVAEHSRDEQLLIDDSAAALQAMRRSGSFLQLDPLLTRSKGVMVFPRVRKGALVVGGAGGRGVMLTQDARGVWSYPAFYNLGAGSVGFQIGYEEATVVLVLMSDHAVASAIRGGFTLGSDVSVAGGNVGDAGTAAGATIARDVIQITDAGGVFAGASLSGAYVDPDTDDDVEYYGPGANTQTILLLRRFGHPGAEVLRSIASGATRGQ
jgi:SH3 domain-containing YSC84-like protein 1